MAKIVWKDLPKVYHLFTKCNTVMVDLDTNKVKMHYGTNTKVNMVQETITNGTRYFRTASAVSEGLNWAIKADSFVLPTDDASLAPSVLPTLNSNSTYSKATRKPSAKQKSIQNSVEAPKSEGEASTRRQGGKLRKVFQKLFRIKK